MRIELFSGYPDYIGKRMAFTGVVAGALALATSDKLESFRKVLYFDAVNGGVTPDGVYRLEFKPAAAEVRTDWFASWTFETGGSTASAQQSAAGSGMTPGTYTINGTGDGSGAQLSVTVTATDITAIQVLNPGHGYSNAPVFSLAAAGGNPATIGAQLSQKGQAVPAGANLSQAKVIVSGFCGQY